MNAAVQPGLTSVIIPCFNQAEFTRLCLRAVLRHTRRPCELILVDNGSTDDTAAYLRGVQDAAPMPVTVIRNGRNLGFPRAINQGLHEARGEYLVLLNNDAVVTDGWLEQLIGLAKMPIDGGATAASRDSQPDLGIGLVGPMSNYATPPQLVDDVPYRDLDEMHAFARRWRDEHRGQWLTAPKLSGFCVLMKRAVYEAIGGLDERFGLGLFDDDDLAERARRAGFELAVAHDLFVHHFGSRTFIGQGIDAEGLLEENARRFADKWGRDTPAGRRVALSPWQPRPEGAEGERRPDVSRRGEKSARTSPSPHRPAGAAAEGPAFPPVRQLAPLRLGAMASPGSPLLHREGSAARAARVSLTMIVRDEEDNLPHCLESARGLFDEIVVVDTGSTDRTAEIARDFGAQVFEFPWIDDFAAARNAAPRSCHGRLYLLARRRRRARPARAGEAHRPAGSPRPSRPTAWGGWTDRLRGALCLRSGAGRTGGKTVVDHIRLFPLRDDVRWTYRVHEQILPALRRAGIPVRWTDLVVRHTGYVDPALRARKLDRDARILHEELALRPDDPFVLFNLGSIAVEREQWSEALRYLERSLAGTGPYDSIRRKLHALIARSHQVLGDFPAALRACAEGLALDAEDAELLFRQAVLHRHRGEATEAAACWRRILTLRRPERFCSVDEGIYGHLTRRNLAVLAMESGEHQEAARLWAEVLAECLGDPEAIARLREVAPGHPALGHHVVGSR